MPSASTHKFQAPKGTRDFFPADMAVRRHLESVWREVSVRHGFEEMDGPTFEHLELYTTKSGPGIVNELFSFRRSGGDTDYALRPEFTPTLARMAAARGGQLPKPIKWFSIPTHFRAERPQRGRLREFLQWNVDVLGLPSQQAEAEVLAVAVGVLERLGLTPRDVRIHVSHRALLSDVLRGLGLADDRLPAAFELLDRRDKLAPEEFQQRAAALGFGADAQTRFSELTGGAARRDELVKRAAAIGTDGAMLATINELDDAASAMGLADWIVYDLGVVRGLAYYTGTVFELLETSGKERALAGGGRYDDLVEQFGGPATPAVGLAMGDVVIRLILEERGLLGEGEKYLPGPDVFVVSAGDDADALLPGLVAGLRRGENGRPPLHVRHSYRATRNIGKLLGDADRARARLALILGRELERGLVVIKDLKSGDQREVALDDVTTAVHAALRPHSS